jgi:peptidoglycan/xylan/chitin deacetylase (PgdA/CDA1 family)
MPHSVIVRLPIPSVTRRIARRLRRSVPRRPRPVILMFHRIAVDSFDPWGLTVSPDNFAAQLEWLKGKRTILTLTEFAAMHREKRLPRNAAAITFDDGYACNIAVAAPLLDRLKIPATIFLSVALIERGGEFWWDELERIVLQHPGPALRLDGIDVPLGPHNSADRVWRPGQGPTTVRQKSFHCLWENLRTRPPAELAEAMLELHSQSPTPPRATHQAMSVKEARGAAGSTIDMGSHTLTHPSLPTLSPQDKATEIISSVERCAAITGSRPRSFAYPYGDRDAESEELVRQAGFLCACTTEHRSLGARGNPFALPRVQVGDWGPAPLARMLAAA